MSGAKSDKAGKRTTPPAPVPAVCDETSPSATPPSSSSASSTSQQAAPASSADDVKSRGWPKGKKRYPKMPGAPKQPLSGYVHFLNDRREDLRKECPDISFADISKKLAVEWANLEPDNKQAYVARADRDKERYAKEFADYQKTDEYKRYMDEQVKKHAAEEEAAGATAAATPPKKKSKKVAAGKKEDEEPLTATEQQFGGTKSGGREGGGGDFALFTNEFLEFNKAREAELRQLRKQVSEMEEQNAVLQKHVDNMQSAITKLEVETTQQQQNSAALAAHLDALRRVVVRELQGVALPGRAGRPVTMDNVDEFMQEVQVKMEALTAAGSAAAADSQDLTLIQKVKEVIGKINYEDLGK